MHLEQRWRRALARGRQPRLIERMASLFHLAIEARSPGKRPPGKAGLRAEKGYYRLLYLQDEFKAAVEALREPLTEDPGLAWGFMQAMLRQLADIPELRSEIIAGIDGALEEIERGLATDG